MQQPVKVVVVTGKTMIITRQSTRALTVSSGMSRRTRGGNGASVPQVVRSFPSGAERVYQHPVDRITRLPTLRARTHRRKYQRFQDQEVQHPHAELHQPCVPDRHRLARFCDLRDQYLDVTRMAMVPYHNRHTPRAMVPDAASCGIVNTFLAAEYKRVRF